MNCPSSGCSSAEHRNRPAPPELDGFDRIRFFMKKLLLLLIIAGTGAGGLYAFRPQWFGTSATPPPVSPAATPTVPAELRDIEYSIQISGDVQPATQLDVKPEVGGRLKKIHVLP